MPGSLSLPLPPGGAGRGYAAAAGIAALLHAGLALPFLLWPTRPAPPNTVAIVEITPIPQGMPSAAPSMDSVTEATPPPPAPQAAPAPPAPEQASTPPPPSTVAAAPQPEPAPPPSPETTVPLLSSPEPATTVQPSDIVHAAPPPEIPRAVPPPPRPAPPAKPVPRMPRPVATSRPAARPAPAPQAEAAVQPMTAAPPAAAAPSAASPAAASASAIPGWRSALISRLQQAKRYPAGARSSGEQGVATVTFTMDRSGHVLSAVLVRSSGSAALDAEATAMVHRAEPLPPLPADLPGSTVTMTIPVGFRLEQ